jgi:2-polyprenyl-3-methyl-5-hydroxy-6-metoxy-1,4-benzoquinol methylase
MISSVTEAVCLSRFFHFSMSTETYHDYVIKDGQFVGKFDEMYQKFDDPWMQSRQPNPYSRMATIINIQRVEVGSILEVGCGLGHYSQAIFQQTGIIPVGIDVSETAIAKAKVLYPHLNFSVDTVDNLTQYKDLDAILFAEVTWYILDQLPAIFETMREHFRGKLFFHNLVFYKGTQRYGTDYFTSLATFIDYVPFPLIAQVEGTTVSDSTIETATVFRIE